MGVEKIVADLSGLRRKIRALLITQASAALIGAVGGVCLAGGVLDYFFHFPWYVRVVCAGFLSAWCGRYVYRRIYLPATLQVPLDQLALALPSVPKEIRDRMASSLAYAQQGAPGSDHLWRQVMDDSAGALQGERLVSRLSSRGTWRAVGYAVGAIVAIGVARYAFADLFGVGLRRVATPWRDVRWPRQVEIEAVSGDGVVARGESFRAQMRLARGGDSHLRAYINFHFADGRIGRELLRRDLDGIFRRTIENLQGDVKYSFSAGDDDTSDRPFVVRVRQRPEVASARIKITPPEYTGEAEAIEASLGETPVDVVEHSRVELIFVFENSGIPDAAIGSAAVQFSDGKRLELMKEKGIWTAGFTAEMGARANGDGQADSNNRPGRLVQFAADALDVAGLRSGQEHRYAIEVRRDKPPKVRIVRPESLVELTPRGSVDIETAAEDDSGIVALRLIASDQRAGMMKPIADLLPGARQAKSRRKIEAIYQWNLGEMPLAAGDVLEYAAEAEDALRINGKARTAARSAIMRIAIVSADAYSNRVRQELVGLRKGLQRVLAELESVRERARILDADPSSGKALDSAGRQAIEQLSSRNMAASERMLETARRLGEIVRRSEMNRLAAAESSRQAKRLHEELHNIAGEQLQSAAESLNQAAQSMAAVEQHEHLKNAVDEEEQGISALKELLDSVDQWNQFEDLVRRTQELLDRQEGLFREVTDLARNQSGDAKSDVGSARQSQKQLAGDTTKLASAMKKMSAELLESDRAGSDSLAHAAEMCYQQNVSGKMEEAAEELRLGRFNLAMAAQSSAAAGLRAMLSYLEEKPQRELAELTRQLQDQIKKLEKIIAVQQELIARTDEAAKDLEQASWKAMSVRQDTLGRTSASFGKGLKEAGAGADRAKAEMGTAAEKMSDAAGDLREKRINPAREKQGEALAGLERARQLLKEWEQKADQDLAEKSLALIVEGFVEIHRKEQEIRNETADVVERSAEKRGRSRAEGMRMQRIATRQRELVPPLEKLKEKVAQSVVFAYVCEQVSGKMETIAEHLAERRGADALAMEEEILKQLGQLISALDEPPGPEKQANFVDSDQQGAAAQPTSAKPVPTLAELKALRLMQADIHQQTIALNKVEPKEDERQIARLGKSQADIHEMAVKMLEKAQEGK